MTGPPGDELAELLWDHGPALRRPPAPAPPPPFFQPFTCSAAGSSRSHELNKRAAADATTTKAAAAFASPVPVPVSLGMHGLGGLPVVQDDDDDAVPWLHCPVGVDDGDGDADTAPLPPEYCASLLSDYSDVSAPAPAPAASHHAAAVVPAAPPPPEAAAAANKLAPPSGEGVVNFTFFSRPLQRPPPASAPATSHPVESTVVQAAAAATTSRLRGTPLFSEQRMAWLQPPPKPAPPRAATAGAAVTPPPRQPPPPPPPLVATALLPDSRHGETAAQPRPQPEAGVPHDAAAVTTSSVCSGNGDRGQIKRSSHLTADCSFSPDEDMDDEPGATRTSAARSAKRSRTAEVHNLSERRRRDRINEKMRALQELIPNCNKIDKASMLEEAIEYLKTLQLQVQMMSMGTGLCMPPPAMLLPALHHQQMQALHHHSMAHFPHLGMGLGFGMGMGATAAAGFAAGAPHFPCPPMAMPPPGAVFGVPGQGMAAMNAAFAHMAGAAPAAQMEAAAAAAAGAAPARPGEAEHPPGRGVAQGDQEAQQHPKQT